jgi:hypothetical protein
MLKYNSIPIKSQICYTLAEYVVKNGFIFGQCSWVP